MEWLMIRRNKISYIQKIRKIFENKKIVDLLVLLFIITLISFVFYLTSRGDITQFHIYSKLFYLAIIIASLQYNLRIAILIPTLISIGELLYIYLSDKVDILALVFIFSIPMYYFTSLIVAYAKFQTITLRRLINEINQSYEDMESALIKALEAKDLYTQGHSERVCRLVSQIISKMVLEEDEKKEILRAAKLHDIGKIGIKDEILNKPGRLTEEEFAQIMDHPIIGYEIIKKIKNMENIAKIIRHHHERYDGNGYPDGLKGEEIPLGSRIIAVADSFDAMISKRSYRDAFTVAQAVKEIKQNSGKQFDPQVVSSFMYAIQEIGLDY